MRILITIITLVLTSLGHSQVSSFFKLYSDQGDDNGQGIVELSDSSYAVTGSSSSFAGAFGSEAFLLKIDSAGGYEWSTHYGGPESDVGRRVLYTENVGYFIAGYTNSYGNGGYDYYLIKTDVDGNLLWEKTYGGSGWERIHDAGLTRDSGIVMIGETSSNFPENKDMYIVRTDKNGDVLWTMVYGGEGDDVLEALDQATDSTYYAVGHIYDPLLDQTFAYSMFFHEDGTVYWRDSIGSSGDYYFHGVTVDTVLNEVVAVGHHVPDGETQKDQFFARISYSGIEIGWYTNVVALDQVSTAVTTFGQPGMKMIGFSHFDATSFEDGDDVALLLYNPALAFISTSFQVNFPLKDEISQVIPTQDGGVIAVGRTNSQGDNIGVNHVFVAKANWNDSPSTIIPHTFETIVALDEGEHEDYLTVYPNPSNGLLNVTSSTFDAVEIQICSVLGQPMLSVNMHGTIKLDMSSFPTGTYMMKTKTSSGISNVRKIVVHR
jgi:hypothetical protein